MTKFNAQRKSKRLAPEKASVDSASKRIGRSKIQIQRTRKRNPTERMNRPNEEPNRKRMNRPKDQPNQIRPEREWMRNTTKTRQKENERGTQPIPVEERNPPKSRQRRNQTESRQKENPRKNPSISNRDGESKLPVKRYRSHYSSW